MPTPGTTGRRHTTTLWTVLASRVATPSKPIVSIAALAALYYATARLGQLIAIPPGNVTAVWFPAGVALVALLLFGNRLWPGIWLGALAANTWAFFDPTSAGTISRSLIVGASIATGATLQAIVGAYFVTRRIDSDGPCGRGRNVVKFAFLAGVVSCVISASVGVTSLSLGGFLDWGGFGPTWLTWWLGDTTGVIVIGLLALSWCLDPPRRLWSRSRNAELLTLFALVIVVVHLAFGKSVEDVHWKYLYAYATIALLVWPAVRFGKRETITAAFVMSLVAIWEYTQSMHHPGQGSAMVLSLQGFVGMATVTSMSLAANTAHRQQTAQNLVKYKAASLQTADHWMITDLNGVILEVNPSFEKLTGYTMDEAIGKKPSILKSGKHNRAFYERMWKTILSGQPFRGVTINKKKDGELFYEMKTITPIKDAQGQPHRFLSIGKDITDLMLQKKELAKTAAQLELANDSLLASEQALSRQLDILQSVFGSMKEGVIVADEEGRFVMFNEAAEKMIGIGATDTGPGEWAATYGVYQTDNETPFPNDELPLVRAINGHAMDGVELTVRNPKKLEGVWLRISANPIRDEDGALRGGLMVMHDITEAKRADQSEAELRATRAELGIARDIHKRLLPDSAPRIPGFDIAGDSRPATEVGGDYFDFFTMPDDTLGIAVGDVSGHGLGPALLMASVRGNLRALVEAGLEPNEILKITNQLIGLDTGDESFVTFSLARIDPRSRLLWYTSAGHTTAYLLDKDRQVKERLESTGLPLGVLPELDLETTPALQLESGDMLVILTDGIQETECSDGSFLGVERTLDMVRDNGHKPASEIVQALFAQVLECRHGDDLDDDVTAVVVKVS